MKIKIESDGNITKVYKDGIEYRQATGIWFFAEPGKATCSLEEYKVDENGRYVTKDGEIVKKMHFDLFSEGDNE